MMSSNGDELPNYVTFCVSHFHHCAPKNCKSKENLISSGIGCCISMDFEEIPTKQDIFSRSSPNQNISFHTEKAFIISRKNECFSFVFSPRKEI